MTAEQVGVNHANVHRQGGSAGISGIKLAGENDEMVIAVRVGVADVVALAINN